MIPIKDDIPSSTFPYVTISIIVLNIMVFVYELSLGPVIGEGFIYRTAVIPYEIVNLMDIDPVSVLPPPFTLLSGMFVHSGFFHVAGNMLFLWIFGDNVEDALGHIGYLVFYLSTGVIASLAHIYTEPDSYMPMIGASGAVAGVLGAYILLYPRARVKTLVFLFLFVTVARVPAVVFLGLWFLLQVVSSGGGGGVAWYAHIGGFVAGMAVVALLGPARLRGR